MMTLLYQDSHFTFRFADDRIIPRFHLEGVEAGRIVCVFKINPQSGERLGLLATATVGEGGWVDLGQPIIVQAGDAFIDAIEDADIPAEEKCEQLFELLAGGLGAAGRSSKSLTMAPRCLGMTSNHEQMEPPAKADRRI